MTNLPVPVTLSEADYRAIEGAVMETARGRWFLAEYARRNRQSDTTMLLKALDRIESAMRGQRSVEPVDRIRFDLVEMSKAIARTKSEIASIKPDADDHGKFGEASEELDSVVQATEAATSDILACAERIQEMAWTLREQGLENEVCDLLDAKATEVYTACSFQDLTGQRTRKVIGVLRYLEDRINAMIGIWGLDGAMATEAAAARAVDGDNALLNGPAKPGHGLDQADVDMVMGPAATAPRAPIPAPDMVIEAVPVEIADLALVEADDIAPPLQPADADADVDDPIAHAGLEIAARDIVIIEPGEVVAAEAAPHATVRAASDPMAPIMALSAEEKIALFT